MTRATPPRTAPDEQWLRRLGALLPELGMESLGTDGGERESWRSPALRTQLRARAASPGLFAAGDAAYRQAQAFFDRHRAAIRARSFPALGPGHDIHHRVELQVLRAYPGAFRAAELNGGWNFVPVPLRFHRAWIRRFWNRRYELLDQVIAANGLRPGTPAFARFVRGRILAWARSVDGAIRRHLAGRSLPAALAPPKPATVARPRWVGRYRPMGP